MSKNQQTDVAQTDLIYILSPSYSGSTLLTMLFATHSDISTIGELKATAMGDISKYQCSCGSLITQCRFWNQIIDEFEKSGRRFSLNDFGTSFDSDNMLAKKLLRSGVRNEMFERLRDLALSTIPAFNKTLKTIMDQNEMIIEFIRKFQGGDVFLDGSKTPVRLKLMLKANRWNIKIIYLVRDGRGVTNSMMKHNQIGMQEAATEWLRNQTECQRIVEHAAPGKVYTLKYEELCKRPEEMMNDLFDFSSIEKLETFKPFDSVEQHILGNAMRLNSTSEIRLDEKWKTVLKETDLSIFENVAGNFNRSLGY